MVYGELVEKYLFDRCGEPDFAEWMTGNRAKRGRLYRLPVFLVKEAVVWEAPLHLLLRRRYDPPHSPLRPEKPCRLLDKGEDVYEDLPPWMLPVSI